MSIYKKMNVLEWIYEGFFLCMQLLKLDSPVQFGSNGNNNIQPICLTRSGGYEGTTVTVAGWGIWLMKMSIPVTKIITGLLFQVEFMREDHNQPFIKK